MELSGHKRKRLIFSCIVVAMLATVSIIDGGGFRHYLKLSRDLGAVRERIRTLDRENMQMIEEIRSLRDDPAALERAAREELNFIRPGELVIQLE